MAQIKVQILGVSAAKTFNLAEPTTAREIFRMTDLKLESNMTVKLDGALISPDDLVAGGQFLIATTQIKGN